MRRCAAAGRQRGHPLMYANCCCCTAAAAPTSRLSPFPPGAQVTKRVVFATVVVCTGCILLVLFGNHESPTLSTHDMMELYSQ